MPTFNLQCPSCDFAFKRHAPTPVGILCPGCGTPAKTQVSEKISGTFVARGETGSQTTGLASVDYNPDRAVAEVSVAAWSKISDTHRAHADLLRNHPGRTGQDIVKTKTGYAVAPKAVVEQARATRELAEHVKKTGQKVGEDVEVAKGFHKPPVA